MGGVALVRVARRLKSTFVYSDKSILHRPCLVPACLELLVSFLPLLVLIITDPPLAALVAPLQNLHLFQSLMLHYYGGDLQESIPSATV